MLADPTIETFLIRLALSFGAAALLGWNREELGHPAGLRTHVLICVAACTAMQLGNWLLVETGETGNGLFKLDLMRLAQGVLAGIGFIGAGTILKQGNIVRGVTTAATVWLVTVIGLCFGAGAWRLGLCATGATLATLQGLGWVERALRQRSYGTMTVAFDPRTTSHATLLKVLAGAGLGIRSRVLEADAEAASLRCIGAYRGREAAAWSLGLVERLRGLPGVGRVTWEEMG
ncbi:MgtC/SapB family protein [Methylobacterium sp. J-026]|uniref:MgtC/SapB family protein n=1 Tax=Methylobacterium sp. J-026 TaxID=2836624 RepID=UPI001FBBFB8E|nr:MgtC/SapB family protein [Methylobacterium sp. J-026]MCJ2138134.1 MgtC/SapB family protein [Methylobacterium sp. J-026]